ncbi:hypothetical protein SRHO_G00258360 [Serrasalmus rhombeus]
MDLCAVKSLLLLSVHIHLTSAASHSLQYVYTAVTQTTRFPEFTVVGLLDGEQIVYYDSNSMKVMPKTEWMRKIGVEDSMALLKASVDSLMKRFNQTKGVQTLQRIYGCELHDDGTKTAYDQFGCDGEDVLSLDLNTGTWTAANQKAVSATHKWQKTCDASFRKGHLENECIYWLQKFVEHGRSTLERKVPPKVNLFLFQKDSSSPVVCHATGFFPKAVMISWQKNGEDLHEDVELRETLPNHDGTFQKRSVLTVSPEELDKHHYTCIIQHGGLEKELRLQVSERRVLPDGGSVYIIIGVVMVVLLLIFIGCIGVFIFKKKQSGFKPVAANPNASHHSLHLHSLRSYSAYRFLFEILQHVALCYLPQCLSTESEFCSVFLSDCCLKATYCSNLYLLSQSLWKQCSQEMLRFLLKRREDLLNHHAELCHQHAYPFSLQPLSVWK